MAVSIDDVAARAGVSTATVSRALRGLPRVSETTRAKVLEVAQSLGYVPSPSASGLASGRTRTVGVLVPFVDRWFFGHVIEGIDQVLRENNYNLLLFSLGGFVHGSKRGFTQSMVRKQIDGLIVPSLGLTEEELRQLHKTELPLLSVGGPLTSFPGVYIDDNGAAALATRHLIDLGHRDIAFISNGDDQLPSFKVPLIRADAFAATMLAAGLEVREEWLVPGHFTVAGGVVAAAQLFDLPERPTAIFSGSDEMALGVLFEAKRRNIRVPEELSVIGIDDHEFAGPAGLTTIAQLPIEHGKEAAQQILAELAGSSGALSDVRMPYELIVRSTTTAPPSSF